MPRSKKTSSNSDNTTPIEHLKHDDQRVNIPTEELRGFVTAEQPPMMRYPRDPSLDPQLVWKGKDEQDGQDLEVPTVPLYIQEHIHPHALIEEFRRELKGMSRNPMQRNWIYLLPRLKGDWILMRGWISITMHRIGQIG